MVPRKGRVSSVPSTGSRTGSRPAFSLDDGAGKNSIGTRFAPPTVMQHELQRSMVLFRLLRLSPSTTLESRRRLGNWIGSSILARHWHCKTSPDPIVPSKGGCASAREGCALDKLIMLSTPHSCSLSAHTCLLPPTARLPLLSPPGPKPLLSLAQSSPPTLPLSSSGAGALGRSPLGCLVVAFCRPGSSR